ncbi:LysR family transcriptional regulator [Brachybacterium sacelli]|uniref:DNA-binding transcriptional LysR family regulator n=1 Tax=Brachybacterium sacelli TaxID=173364 RepID=A0ABS4WWN3_9MICO|nr:LysR family transcriptional regulator [Brachybacterium sacelli]MBP2380624.1 DNA-binding transcriptional LysR family regulator [Brachybacterium sacelli]
MLDPVKLRVLRSVVETGSIRASAEALGYTPSAVSQHLSTLRRETGLELVERTGRGITVTAHARILAEEAGTALDALAVLERTVKDLRSGRTGTLRLGYATSIASTWIPELARDVRRRYPDLGLELALRDCSCEDLAEAGMDIIVGEGTADAVPEEWAVQDILEEGYVALVGTGHPLAGRSSLPMKDLADQSWVTDDPLESFWFDRIGSACRAAGFSPCVDANPNDFPTVLGFVATGDYVSVQPSVIAQYLRPDVLAIPLDPPAPRRRLRVQVRRTVERNPAARYIVQRIHAAAERRAREIPGAVHLGVGPTGAPSQAATEATAPRSADVSQSAGVA